MSGVIRIVPVEVDEVLSPSLHDRNWSFDGDERVTSSDGSACPLVALLVDKTIQGLIEFEIRYQDLFAFVHKLEIDPRNRGQNPAHPGIAGMLLAYVARQSFYAGLDGFVVLVSKTALWSHYQVRYGAKP